MWTATRPRGPRGTRAGFLGGRRPAALAAVVVPFAVVAGCADLRGAEVGREAPGFEAEELTGGKLSLEELRGEVVVLNLWATWCAPCRREMPALQRLQDELGHEGLRVVAVSIDGAGDRRAIEDFIVELGLDFTILHDPAQRFVDVFGTRGVPHTFLIGRDGVVRAQWIGRIDPGAPGFRRQVHDALDGRELQEPRISISSGNAPPAS